MRRFLFLALPVLAVLAAAASHPAAAQSCQASVSGPAFGTVDLMGGASARTGGSVTVSCSGGQAGATLRVCLDLGGVREGGRRILRGPGGARLAYEIFADPGLAQPWGSVGQGGNGIALDIPLTGFTRGSGSRTIPFYAAILGGQGAAPVGAYAGQIQDGASRLTLAPNLMGCGLAGQGQNPVPISLQASATIAAHCSVTAAPMDFGTVSDLGRPHDAVSQIAVTCAAGTPYRVGLNGGQAGAGDPAQRRMVAGDGRSLTYGLYRDPARQQVWGNRPGQDMVAGVGSAAAQAFPVYGRVPPQPAAPGTFQDTIVVSVDF